MEHSSDVEREANYVLKDPDIGYHQFMCAHVCDECVEGDILGATCFSSFEFSSILFWQGVTPQAVSFLWRIAKIFYSGGKTVHPQGQDMLLRC